MQTLLWVSRHELTDRNHSILRKAFGEYEVVQYRETVQDVKQLKQYADENGVDAYIVVLPPNLIMELMKIDRRPIYRFITERKVDEQGNAIFTPIGLEKIEEIKIVTTHIV